MAPCRALQVPSSFEVPSNTLGQPDEQQREDLGYSGICGTSYSCRRSLRHRCRGIAVGADLLFEQPYQYHVPYPSWWQQVFLAPRLTSLRHCRSKVSNSYSTSTRGNRSAWMRFTCCASPALPLSTSIEGNGDRGLQQQHSSARNVGLTQDHPKYLQCVCFTIVQFNKE